MKIFSHPTLEINVQAQPSQLRQKEVIVMRWLDQDQKPKTWLNIAEGLSESQEFRLFWSKVHRAIPFDYQWKPVPIHPASSQTHPFFIVFVPAVFAPASPRAYQAYLKDLPAEQSVTSFLNLSGDATLVIPEATGDYGHLAQFCHQGEPRLQEQFWLKVGQIAQQKIIQQEPVWCNTHGHGVPWLHIRFDRRQKYTAFPPHGEITEFSQREWYETIYEPAFENCDFS